MAGTPNFQKGAKPDSMPADPMRDRVAELRDLGWGYKTIAREVGVSASTVRRWVDPDFRKRDLAVSLAAKKRRTGTCVDCGAVTRYGGHGRGTSERCPPCGAIYAGQQKTIWTAERVIEAIQLWAAEHGGEPPAQPDWSPTNARLMGDEWRAIRFENDDRWPWSTSVVYRFGSFNAGIEAAGFTPRPAHGGGGNEERRRSMRAKVAA